MLSNGLYQEKVGEHSNRTILVRLLHLARVTVFTSFPLILHVNYEKYRFDVFNSPGGPYPSLVSYPFVFVVPAVVLIGLDVYVLQKHWKTLGGYVLPTLGLLVSQVILLFITDDLLFVYGLDIPATVPVVTKVLLILGVSLLGTLEMGLLAKGLGRNQAISDFS